MVSCATRAADRRQGPLGLRWVHACQRATSDASRWMPARKAAGGSSAGQGGACRVRAGLGRQRADDERARASYGC